MSALMKQMLADSPVGLWWMDDTASPVRDIVAARNGTASGVTFRQPSVVSPYSVSFAAAGTIQIAHAAAFNLNDAITVLSWFKTTSHSGVGQVGSLLDRDGQQSNGVRSWQLRVDQGKACGIIFTDPFAVVISTGTTTVTDGQWHLMAMRYDKVSLDTLVDGRLEATTPSTNPIQQTTAPLWFGATQYGSGQNYTGNIGPSSLYGTALSTDRIKAIYRAGVRSGVVAG
jgi:hypothetical protein